MTKRLTAAPGGEAEAVFTVSVPPLRDMGRDRNPAWAIAAVPEAMVKEFSTRARHIDAETDRLIGQYVDAHGRRPSPATDRKSVV